MSEPDDTPNAPEQPPGDDGCRWDAVRWRCFLDERVDALGRVYATSPQRVVSDWRREETATGDYRGRELLELLQNADDEATGGDGRVVVELTHNGLLVANTGRPFSARGVDSLLTADNSPKQFDRARFIGNKGLGFRSILGWSDRPFVSSGSLAVRFDRTHALEWITRLGERQAGVGSVLEEHWRRLRSTPVATLALPFAIEDLGALTLGAAARRLRQDERFDTVVAIPFFEERPEQEAREQIAAIGREVLLFTRHVRAIELRLPEGVTRWFVDDRDDKAIVLRREGAPAERWRVWTERGTVPPDRCRPDQRLTPDFEIRIALPEAGAAAPRAVLFSYFPTRVALPVPAVVHATVELTSNREYLVDSLANRWLVPEIARALVEAACTLAVGDDPFRVLRVVAPVGDVDANLSRFGFEEALLGALRKRPAVPVRDGSLVRAEQAALVEPRPLDWLPAQEFGDIAPWPNEDSLRRLMRQLKLRPVSDEELARRLLAASAALTADGLASVVAGVLVDLPGRFAAGAPRGLLRDDAGSPVPGDARVFLPPGDGQGFTLPDWLPIRLLARDLGDRLRAALRVTSAQEMASRLRPFDVRDYALGPILSALVAEGQRRTREAAPGTERHAWRKRVLEAIATIHRSYGTAPPTWPADVRVVLPARTGADAHADTLYLGGDWPGGLLCERLLPRRPDRLVASPDTLGFADRLEEGPAVLRWLGVATSPRRVRARPQADGGAFLGWVKEQLAFPAPLGDGSHLSAAADLDGACIEQVSSFDLIDDILTHGSPDAIIAWMAQEDWLD